MSTPVISPRRAYDLWASTYDTDINPTRDMSAKALRHAELALDGAYVIEVGSGTGINTAYLARRAGRVIALDFSRAMMKSARRRIGLSNVDFVEHDAVRRWPVSQGCADFVVCCLVLEHIQKMSNVFCEARRALRPGGILYLCELHPYRQLLGSGARFCKGDREVRPQAFSHSVSDYVVNALTAGFSLLSLSELVDACSSPEAEIAPPRLLQIQFTAVAKAAL